MVKLDYQIQGQIAIDKSGRPYFEGDLNLRQWRQGIACAHVLARLIEQVFALEKDRISCRLRVIQSSRSEVSPQVLLVSTTACSDSTKLTSLILEFASRISDQRELLDVRPGAQVDETTRTKTEVMAATLLDAFGGRSVHKQIQFCVDEADVASIRGQWKARQTAAPIAPVTHDYDAWYDGRRLRSRTLFVVITKPNVKGLEVNYDDQTFDQQLRDLDDDKNAILKIKVEERSSKKGKTTLRLLELSLVVPMKEVELLAIH